VKKKKQTSRISTEQCISAAVKSNTGQGCVGKEFALNVIDFTIRQPSMTAVFLFHIHCLSTSPIEVVGA